MKHIHSSYESYTFVRQTHGSWINKWTQTWQINICITETVSGYILSLFELFLRSCIFGRSCIFCISHPEPICKVHYLLIILTWHYVIISWLHSLISRHNSAGPEDCTAVPGDIIQARISTVSIMALTPAPAFPCANSINITYAKHQYLPNTNRCQHFTNLHAYYCLNLSL